MSYHNPHKKLFLKKTRPDTLHRLDRQTPPLAFEVTMEFKNVETITKCYVMLCYLSYSLSPQLIVLNVPYNY